MKVHELITKLQSMDQDLDVYVPSKMTEHDYCLAYSVRNTFANIEEDEETLVVTIEEN